MNLDDCLVHSPTLEQHLLDVLEIFRRRQLFAKSFKGEFGRQELDILGHRLSKDGVWEKLNRQIESLRVIHKIT